MKNVKRTFFVTPEESKNWKELLGYYPSADHPHYELDDGTKRFAYEVSSGTIQYRKIE